jgi:hypothetical protein
VAVIREVKADKTNTMVGFSVLTPRNVKTDSTASTLKKNAAFSSERLIPTCDTSWCQKLEDCNLNDLSLNLKTSSIQVSIIVICSLVI